MNGLNIYPVVYTLIKKYIKTHIPPNDGLKRFWDFARIIPDYREATSEQADAICTSVSHSTKFGLEAFYNLELEWELIASIIMKRVIFVDEPDMLKLRNFFYDDTLEHRDKIVLGDFVRYFFDGRKVLNKNDEKILANIKHKEKENKL